MRVCVYLAKAACLKTVEQMSVMAETSFRLFAGACCGARAIYPQIKCQLADVALTRASNASRMRFQSPEGIPCIYIPYAAASSHTTARRHALESAGTADSAARVVSKRRLYRASAPHHKCRRRVLAGYTKLFKWDLLDGTLPNALPASSRITASYKIQNPEELIFSTRGNKVEYL